MKELLEICLEWETEMRQSISSCNLYLTLAILFRILKTQARNNLYRSIMEMNSDLMTWLTLRLHFKTNRSLNSNDLKLIVNRQQKSQSLIISRPQIQSAHLDLTSNPYIIRHSRINSSALESLDGMSVEGTWARFNRLFKHRPWNHL